MKRITPLILIALAAAALTACGSRSQQAQKSAAASHATTRALSKVSGVGRVLVDSKCFALYSPKQDSSKMIRCTGSCTAIWVPLTVKGSPTGDSSVAGELRTGLRPHRRQHVRAHGN